MLVIIHNSSRCCLFFYTIGRPCLEQPLPRGCPPGHLTSTVVELGRASSFRSSLIQWTVEQWNSPYGSFKCVLQISSTTVKPCFMQFISSSSLNFQQFPFTRWWCHRGLWRPSPLPFLWGAGRETTVTQGAPRVFWSGISQSIGPWAISTLDLQPGSFMMRNILFLSLRPDSGESYGSSLEECGRSWKIICFWLTAIIATRHS